MDEFTLILCKYLENEGKMGFCGFSHSQLRDGRKDPVDEQKAIELGSGKFELIEPAGVITLHSLSTYRGKSPGQIY